MKPLPTLLLVLAVAAASAAGGYFFARHNPEHTPAHEPTASKKETILYTCGMHPQVVQDHPGNCPICGMKLTPMQRGSSGITIDPVTIQNMGLRTTLLMRGPLRRVIRTVGTVDYEEPSLQDVTTKFSGWVEKLYVDAVGAQVHRGDPLFEVYSPELYSAQQEYLLALKSGSASEGLLQTACTKLKYWDISDDQIADLERNMEASKTLRVLAPMDGFVLEKSVVEGQMVGAGMRLYRLADLALVWVHAQLYEQDLPFVRLGQEAVVSLSYLPDRKFRGRVTYLYPTVDPKTRTVQIRMEFHNPGYFLKPGMFASVELTSELAASALLVPDQAVLRSGHRQTVFVALDGGRFAPRQVVLGARAEGDMLQVLDGLEEGERIVVSGQFLLDSESQLQEALQKMTAPEAASPSPEAEPALAQAGAPSTSNGDSMQGAGAAPVYLCPMPEHVAIEYDHPGACPLCSMTLVPVSSDMLQRIQPGGKVEYYTCPMPEHSDVHEDQPGKCPRCRMTLIPFMSPLTPPAEATAPEIGPDLYTCPMASHAHLVFDQPGMCPECEMVLVTVDQVAHGARSRAAWHAAHPDATHAEPAENDPQP